MKQIFTLIFLSMLFTFSINAQQLIISEIVDGPGVGGYPKYVEITNTGSAAVELNGLKILKSGNGDPFQIAFEFTEAFSLPIGESMVVTNMDGVTAVQLWSDYSLTEPTNVIYGAVWSAAEPVGIVGNGDDAYALADASDVIIDVYGELLDGTGLAWEYLDSYVYRNADINTPNTTFTIGEWTIAAINSLDGLTDLSTFLTPGTHTFTAGSSVEALNIDNVRIFPNPATSVLNINSSSNIKNIAVSNVIGQRVVNIDNVNANNHSIELTGFAKGVYLLNIQNVDGTSSIVKFVKR